MLVNMVLGAIMWDLFVRDIHGLSNTVFLPCNSSVTLNALASQSNWLPKQIYILQMYFQCSRILKSSGCAFS